MLHSKLSLPFPRPRLRYSPIFSPLPTMSLNRNEQMVYDYLHSQPDERRHWETVIKREAGRAGDPHAAAFTIEGELWRYYVERSGVAEPFRSQARREGLARTSMRNLAELLIRLWAPPPAKKPQADPAHPPPF
jgi:hypothetical protein